MAVASTTRNITQYLTFKLEDQEYGVDVKSVREVLEMLNITKVPRTPDFMSGVINVRGSVVPVIDMRLKFTLPKAETTIDTCIIVIDVHPNGESITLGMLADSVQEVIDMTPEDVEPTPEIGTRLNMEFLKGIGKRNEKFILILNIEKIFTSDELVLVKEAEKLAPVVGQTPEAE